MVDKLIEEGIVTGPQWQRAYFEVLADAKTDLDDLFAMLRPLLRDSAVTEVEQAALILKVVVYNRVVPMLKRNEGGVADLQRLCLAIDKFLTERSAMSIGDSPVLAAACEELGMVVAYFGALTPPWKPKSLEHVLAVRSASQGALALVKTAAAQSKLWADREASLRKFDLASASLGPDMEAARKELQSQGLGAIRQGEHPAGHGSRHRAPVSGGPGLHHTVQHKLLGGSSKEVWGGNLLAELQLRHVR